MNYCTFPQLPPWGQEESGRGESRGKVGKIGKKEMTVKATLTNSTVSLTVRESRELLMLLYRYDVDLVSLHKFLRKPYLRLQIRPVYTTVEPRYNDPRYTISPV